MKSFQNLLNLCLRSLFLDLKLLASDFPSSIEAKLEFIYKKYFLLVKHLTLKIPPAPGSTYVTINKQRIFYESVYGISALQAMIVTLEKNVLPILKKIKNPIVLDIGAHVGFFSYVLALSLQKSKIYACEPVLLTFELLKKNVHNITSISTFRIGLSDKLEKKTIYYNPRLLIYSSLYKERFSWDQHSHREVIPLTTLDSFCKKNGITRINLLKIDAEGAEKKILKGAVKTLIITQYLLLECSLDQISNSTFASLVSGLLGKGFNFQLVNIGPKTDNGKGQLLTVDMLFRNTLFDSAMKKNKV